MRFQRRQMRPTPAASARPAVTLPSIPYRRAVVLLGLLALCGGHALAQDDDFQARVNAAIERGVAHLKQRQSPDGSWQGPHTLGMTSLCAWTLLEAGVPKTDPALEEAISFVRNGWP